MIETALFTNIEEAYLSDDYQKVVAVWEQHKQNYSFAFENLQDRKLLQALVVSYSELNRIKESVYYINRYIRFLRAQKGNLNEYSDDIDFYFSAKSSIYSKERKWFYEYRTLREYVGLGYHRLWFRRFLQ
ncbi:MAG: hypothetical protein HC896_09840 [Bacteroidales bacterium]|nr:hypothetical protein [Bacteroidales bacterium]